jgi:hypothetical protein
MATKQKGNFMGILQIVIGVVGLIVGLTTLTKESAPYVQKFIERQHQEEIVKRATVQSQMNIQYIYRGNDGTYRYYSDANGVFWMRVNIQGVVEYAQNPQASILR